MFKESTPLTETAVRVLRLIHKLGKADVQAIGAAVSATGGYKDKEKQYALTGQGQGFLGGGYAQKLRKVGLLELSPCSFDKLARTQYRLTMKGKAALLERQRRLERQAMADIASPRKG